MCDEDWCGATKLDCCFIVSQLTAQVLLIFGMFVWAQMSRINTLLFIKNQVDEPDLLPEKHSKLVLCEVTLGTFQCTNRQDIRECASSAALLPGIRVFLNIWGLCHRLRRCLPPAAVEGFHAMEATQKLLEADELKGQGAYMPEISRFMGVFPRTEETRMLDVGSGEMGFYTYWIDQDTGYILSKGANDKLKYNSGATFVDHFVEDPRGAERLAKEIVDRFNLSSCNSSFAFADDRRSRRAPSSGTHQLSRKSLAGSHRAACCGSRQSDNTSSDVLGLLSPVIPGRVSSENFRAQEDLPDLSGNGHPFVDSSLQPFDSVASPSGRSRTGTPGRRSDKSIMVVTESDDGDLDIQVGASMSRKTRTGRTVGGPSSGIKKGKQKLLMCLTGANRQMLSKDAQGRKKLHGFVSEVNDLLEAYGMECVEFFPQDVDEAMYELAACEWVVQHGDLDVTRMSMGGIYRKLHDGDETAFTTLDEVLKEFRWLDAEQELRNAFSGAVRKAWELELLLQEERELLSDTSEEMELVYHSKSHAALAMTRTPSNGMARTPSNGMARTLSSGMLKTKNTRVKRNSSIVDMDDLRERSARAKGLKRLSSAHTLQGDDSATLRKTVGKRLMKKQSSRSLKQVQTSPVAAQVPPPQGTPPTEEGQLVRPPLVDFREEELPDTPTAGKPGRARIRKLCHMQLLLGSPG
jgi:hypothetical protein